ncbi:MAG: hypothetical protein RLZZ32_1423 [Cyanobacteriota bacterium]
MALDITARITGDDKLSTALSSLSSHDIPKAIRAGVRDAARAGRTVITKNVGQHYNLKAARIKQDISSPQFLDGGQTAILRTSRKPITAMQFNPRQTPDGLSMAVFRGSRTLVKSGFLAKKKNLPFKRRGKERKPLDIIHGPSIHAIYSGGKHADAIQHASAERIEQALSNGIIRSLGGMARGFGR